MSLIGIEIAWEVDGVVQRSSLTLDDGASLGEALELARSLGRVPPEIIARSTSAVFGRLRGAGHRLADGDRIELTGPLRVDPKVARERRVAHKRAAEPRSRWRPQGR